MSAIKLRVDYDAARTRRLAARAKDPDQVRRLLALSAVYEGRS
ncbi:MAG: IS630 family transposase, partial [Gemmatimonadaceae bacterium]|nr:IS630 family transposase [Caulobacter sp.]